jgi:hypothetical protein
MKTTTARLAALLPAFVAVSSVFAVASPSKAADLPAADLPISQVVDTLINARMADAKVTPAGQVDDSGFIRRVTLDLAGRTPTLAEVKAYVESTEPDKKVKLVDRLIASPDFIHHHRNELESLLMEQSDGKFREWLTKAVKENRPWDEIFRQMMVGREDNPDEQPALTFLKQRVQSPDDLTNDVARLFFGVSVNCAKCHDHPLVTDWKQDHYFGFLSFFNRTYKTKKNILAEKFSGEVKFKTTKGEEKLARMMFITGASFDEPKVEKTKEQLKAEDDQVKKQMEDDKAEPPPAPPFSPRAKFVELALQESDTPFFARNITNRMWVRMLGRGIVDPPDQMHSGNLPSHPELLDWLTRDTVAHKYDLRRLLRGIALSEAYARSTQWTNPGDTPPYDLFALGLVRALTPRQYGAALVIASTSPDQYPLDIKPEDWEKRRDGLEGAASSWGGNIEKPNEHFQVPVDEALFFSNNKRIEDDLVRDSPDRLVGKLKSMTDRRQQIDLAFRNTVCRPPNDEEIAASEAYLETRKDRPVDGLKQFVWSLLTSPEVRFNY